MPNSTDPAWPHRSSADRGQVMNKATIPAYADAIPDPVTRAYPLGNGYRFYSPALTRFTAPDADSPFALGGLNGYGYCLGNPVTGTDPTGHVPMFRLEEMLPHLDVQAAEAAAEFRPGQLDAADLDRWLGEEESPAPHSPALLAPGGGPGPGTSAAGRAGGVAAHAGGAATLPDAPVGQQLARLDVPRGIPPPAIVLRALPQDDLGLKRFFNSAYGLGYVTLSPDGPAKSAILFTIHPRIALLGRLLDHHDPDVVELMKRFGASRGQPKGGWRDRPYTVSLTAPVAPESGLIVALGGRRPGRHGFDPILLSAAQTRTPHLKRAYTREFRDRAALLRLNIL
ncbi:RHS repeat-associated core domain-containing protein [Bordetella bronchialis]|nr:RHS repeat-associated core domain-containing protein [Bordetella bronchialis]